MRNKNSFSFTLIELLIALSIFAVVAIALYSTFSAGIAVWRRSSEGRDAYQNVKFIFDDITKDLKNALYLGKNEESMYAFSGASSEIIFMTLEDTSSEEEGPQKEIVKLAYKYDGEQSELIRLRADISTGFDIKRGEKEILFKNIEEFKFEYCYDSGDEDNPYLWKDEWENEDIRIPRGVRITVLTKVGKTEKKTSKFIKTVFIPTGILGEKEL